MSLELSGRRIVIAGGTSGIGRATAKSCSEKGASTLILGRNPQKLSSAVNALQRTKGKLCDVRNSEDCQNAIEFADHEMGGIDGLIFCAGVGKIASIEDLSFDHYREMIEVNLIGAFNMIKAIVPFLKTSSNSNIILMGSRAGRYAFKGGTGYCAAKFGTQGLAEALFLDVNKYGIAVTLIAPGTVATGFANVQKQSWHLKAEDIAETVINCLKMHPNANINWIEIRPMGDSSVG